MMKAALLSLLPTATATGYYCGSSYDDAISDCSVPCPSTFGYNPQMDLNECSEDRQYCFGPGLACADNNSTADTNTTNSTEFSPDDPINRNFCGIALESANICTGTSHWCPSGLNSECPAGMHCFENTSCNATEMNLVTPAKLHLLRNNITDAFNITDLNVTDYLYNITANNSTDYLYNSTANTTFDNTTDGLGMVPTPTPEINGTGAPTVDLNPGSYYCAASWRTADYSEDCGPPCPSGQNDECPEGLYCYGPTPDCVKTHKVGVGTKWCGTSFDDMANKCGDECPGGTDEVSHIHVESVEL
jgi:hypothetical protein